MLGLKNETQRKVNLLGASKNEDARIKLKRLYPLIKLYQIKIDDVIGPFLEKMAVQRTTNKGSKIMEKKIKEIIFMTVKGLNETLDEDQQLKLSTETVLLGKDSNINSLTLVNLIVAIEENLEDKLKVSVTLTDEKAFSQKHSPLRTIESLTDYIEILIKEKTNA